MGYWDIARLALVDWVNSINPFRMHPLKSRSRWISIHRERLFILITLRPFAVTNWEPSQESS